VVASQNNIRILNAQSYQIVGGPFERKQPVTKAWLIAKNTLLVTLTEDGLGQIQTVTEDGLGKFEGGSIRPISCEGVGNVIFALALSADEQHIATGCFNGEVTVWDLNGSDAQRQPSLARGGTAAATITALNFSADNKYLASGDSFGAATIWKLGQSEPWIGAGSKGSKESPIKHSKAIRDIGFHPTDSEILVTASDDKTAIVWQLDLPGRRLAPEKKGERTKWTLKHDREVIKAQFTPRADNNAPLMTISGKRIYFWINEESPEIRGQDDMVSDANPSGDRELVVSASSDGTARVWSTRARVPIAVLRGHRAEVTRALFGPGGQVVTTSRDGNVRFWRLDLPSLLASETPWMLAAAFDPAGKRVAVCSEEQCSIIEPQDVSRRQSPDQEKLERVHVKVAGISWSADGRLLLGVGYTLAIDPTLVPILWDTDSRRVITPKWLQQWSMAEFSAGTKELLTLKLGIDNAIAVWDAAALLEVDPKPKQQFAKLPDLIAIEMSPDGRWIAGITKDDRVALWDRTKPESAPSMRAAHQGINNVSFSPDSLLFVTSSIDRTARVWRVDQHPGQPETYVELRGHGAGLTGAWFNHNGQQVVTGSYDHTIRIWNAQNGRELGVLRWHDDTVEQVQFDVHDQRILSASDDGTVKLGRCKVCNINTVAQLHEQAGDEAKMADDELAELQTEIRATMPYLRVPTFLSRNP
jgi:WD40 repeat protein